MEVSVLHLVHRFYVGGSERQFIERLRAHPHGFRPLVACLERSGGNLSDFLALGLGEPRVFTLRGSLLRWNTLVQVGRIAAFARREGARILHGTDFTSNLLAVLAAPFASARSVVSRVDLGHLREGFGPAHRRLERWVARAADAVCANADAVRALCIEEEGCRPERVFTVRNGLDLARFDARAGEDLQGPLPAGRPLVAVVANLWPVKGHRSLLEAWAQVLAAQPDAQLALVGDGPERAFLEGRAAELGLARSVHFLGTRYDVPAILRRADVACLASRAEGLPNAIMESMAAGLPVVATAVGGVPELVREGATGHLVTPDAPAALAGKLLSLLANPQRARAMGLRGREQVERDLSLARLREAHSAVYQAVLAGAAPVHAAALS